MITKINKWLPLAGWTTIIGIIAGGIYWLGGFVNDVNDGVLTPKEKVDVLETVYTLPTPLENYKRSLKMDSVDILNAQNALHAIKSRSMRDTAVKKALDLGQLNADQIYQTRQDVQKILEKIDSIK